MDRKNIDPVEEILVKDSFTDHAQKIPVGRQYQTDVGFFDQYHIREILDSSHGMRARKSFVPIEIVIWGMCFPMAQHRRDTTIVWIR